MASTGEAAASPPLPASTNNTMTFRVAAIEVFELGRDGLWRRRRAAADAEADTRLVAALPSSPMASASATPRFDFSQTTASPLLQPAHAVEAARLFDQDSPPQRELPPGWAWLDGWHVAQPWTYSTAGCSVRRRKWVRDCSGPRASLSQHDDTYAWLLEEEQLDESAKAADSKDGGSADPDDDHAAIASEINSLWSHWGELVRESSASQNEAGQESLFSVALKALKLDESEHSQIALHDASDDEATGEDDGDGDLMRQASTASTTSDGWEKISPTAANDTYASFEELQHPDVEPTTILIMTIGSRGDIQPFVALGKGLQNYGHRVRLAGFEVFRDFVESNGLEFFPLAGDPVSLMKLCVDHSFFSLSFIFEGIVNFRTFYRRLLQSCWQACLEPSADGTPFHPDAVIANPPVTAHYHVAEALGVPLFIGFTMPWSRTGQFPHPMMADRGWGGYDYNRRTFKMLELTTWLGFGDIINSFRAKELKLPKLGIQEGAFCLHKNKVRHFYAYSPNLVPKPRDWPGWCHVTNYWFLDQGKTDWVPPADLEAFLGAGPKPVYVGFGSIPASDAKALTQLILAARERAGVRLILAGGWGGLGGDAAESASSNVFFLKSCPHDWLFPRCSAVVHHGGAGTVAAGLRAGCPTGIVSFFGDQFFWAEIVNRKGVGICTTAHALTEDWLTRAFEELPSDKYRTPAAQLGKEIEEMNGVQEAVRLYNINLPLDWSKRTETAVLFEHQSWITGRWLAPAFSDHFVAPATHENGDREQQRPATKEDVQVSHGWAWTKPWEIVHNKDCDNEGWMYASSSAGPFSSKASKQGFALCFPCRSDQITRLFVCRNNCVCLACVRVFAHPCLQTLCLANDFVFFTLSSRPRTLRVRLVCCRCFACGAGSVPVPVARDIATAQHAANSRDTANPFEGPMLV
eukprot:m.136731 g.136731  ORF g.136731 m.136731 type:complete len:920 (+) comp16980_c0_seq3:426-3185(+)